MAESAGSANQLGDFRLLKKLGEGGMGAVYKARQLSMDRDVALKVLPKRLAKDAAFVERFYREARASAKLDHPNIVRGISVGESQGFHYFAMEFVDGDNCEKLLADQKRLHVGDAVKITLDVARALEHAHSKNMVHRDIKPENIMVTRDGTVKLADLGLAKAIDEDQGLTQTGSGFGTPYYMPPEQARNAKNVDPRSDIYALGATLYHLLTGQLPFHGETAIEVLTAKEEAPHTPARRVNPEVPEVLDLIIDKMMARDQKDRFQSCTELAASLEKTGLAAATLSWVGGRMSLAAGPTRAKTKQSAAGRPSGATAGDAESGATDQYFLRYKDRKGSLVKATGDKHQIREAIRKGMLTTDAEAARDLKGPYRPLLAFPEFADLMKSRLIREKTDKAVGGMADKFAQFDKEDVRLKKRRRLKALLKRALKVIVGILLLGALAAGGYFAWQYFQQSNANPENPTPNATGKTSA